MDVFASHLVSSGKMTEVLLSNQAWHPSITVFCDGRLHNIPFRTGEPEGGQSSA